MKIFFVIVGEGEIRMAVKYRKLAKKDLDLFIKMRINQLREEGAKEDMDLRPALQDYYNRMPERKSASL